MKIYHTIFSFHFIFCFILAVIYYHAVNLRELNYSKVSMFKVRSIKSDNIQNLKSNYFKRRQIPFIQNLKSNHGILGVNWWGHLSSWILWVSISLPTCQINIILYSFIFYIIFAQVDVGSLLMQIICYDLRNNLFGNWLEKHLLDIQLDIYFFLICHITNLNFQWYLTHHFSFICRHYIFVFLFVSNC